MGRHGGRGGRELRGPFTPPRRSFDTQTHTRTHTHTARAGFFFLCGLFSGGNLHSGFIVMSGWHSVFTQQRCIAPICWDSRGAGAVNPPSPPPSPPLPPISPPSPHSRRGVLRAWGKKNVYDATLSFHWAPLSLPLSLSLLSLFLCLCLSLYADQFFCDAADNHDARFQCVIYCPVCPNSGRRKYASQISKSYRTSAAACCLARCIETRKLARTVP